MPEPLTPAVFNILLALTDEPLHGYAIMQAAAEQSAGECRLGPGTLYAAIPKLIESGWIRESRQRPSEDDDPRRRYYELTRSGMAALQAEVERMGQLVRLAKQKIRSSH